MNNERIENPRLVTFQGHTLVDITNTGIVKYSPNDYHKRNQQRNWETVLQILSMRTQLFRADQVNSSKQDLKKFEFGSAYTGKHRVWTFEFEVEFPDAVLIDDFSQVPVIAGLDETTNSDLHLFYTTGDNKNIYFTVGS